MIDDLTKLYKLPYNTDNMIDLKLNLEKIGLSNYEAIILDVLFKNSPSTAAFIAKKCNLARSSVYTTLNSLIGKGLVGTTFKNEIKQFVAEDISAIEEYIEKEKNSIKEKESAFNSLKDEIKQYESDSLNLPQIVVFEGQDGLKKIYLSMLRQAPNNSTIYIIRDEYVWKEEWEFIHKMEWDERAKRIKGNKNISTKLLINDSKLENEKKGYYKSKKHLVYSFLPRKVK